MRELAKRNAETEDRSFRDQLIAEYLPYVNRIVYRVAIHLPPNVEIDDLINAGIVGLIEASEGYDPSRGNKFMTYAMFRIKGAVLSELRTQDFHSRTNRKKIKQMENAYLTLERKLRREVEEDEVAAELGLTLDEFYEIKKMSSISFINFEDIGYKARSEKDRIVDSLICDDNFDVINSLKLKEIASTLAKTIEKLPEKEKMVIALYYWDELTMKEIGKVLDITESRVSQLHSQAIIHLRVKLKREALIENSN